MVRRLFTARTVVSVRTVVSARQAHIHMPLVHNKKRGTHQPSFLYFDIVILLLVLKQYLKVVFGPRSKEKD